MSEPDPAVRRSRRGQSGLSLIELIIVMTLTGVIFGVTQLMLVRTIDTWWRVNANQDSEQQLYKAQNHLERDLRGAAFETQPDRATIAVRQQPSELTNLSGADGDVLWFLSAVDPLSGKFIRKPDGSPFWQRNVVYYAVSPLGLDQLGYSGAGLDSGGYEVACPFKMLVRKEIDSGVATNPDSNPSTTVEKLMTFDEVAGHLNRPNGYSCAGMSAANSTVKPVAAHLLSFRADLDEALRGVNIEFRCTAIERARREGGISNRDLSEQPATTQLQVVLLPPNRPPTL